MLRATRLKMILVSSGIDVGVEVDRAKARASLRKRTPARTACAICNCVVPAALPALIFEHNELALYIYIYLPTYL